MIVVLLTIIIQNKYFKSSITVFELVHTTLNYPEEMVTGCEWGSGERTRSINEANALVRFCLSQSRSATDIEDVPYARLLSCPDFELILSRATIYHWNHTYLMMGSGVNINWVAHSCEPPPQPLSSSPSTVFNTVFRKTSYHDFLFCTPVSPSEWLLRF